MAKSTFEARVSSGDNSPPTSPEGYAIWFAGRTRREQRVVLQGFGQRTFDLFAIMHPNGPHGIGEVRFSLSQRDGLPVISRDEEAGEFKVIIMRGILERQQVFISGDGLDFGYRVEERAAAWSGMPTGTYDTFLLPNDLELTPAEVRGHPDNPVIGMVPMLAMSVVGEN